MSKREKMRVCTESQKQYLSRNESFPKTFQTLDPSSGPMAKKPNHAIVITYRAVYTSDYVPCD